MSEPRPGDIVALIEFLNARLDEDERAARDASPDGWDEADLWDDMRPEAREHFQRHDPARVLREVEAKRKLVAIALENAADADNERGDGHTAEEIAAGRCSSDYGLWAALRNLAPLASIWEGS